MTVTPPAAEVPRSTGPELVLPAAPPVCDLLVVEGEIGDRELVERALDGLEFDLRHRIVGSDAAVSTARAAGLRAGVLVCLAGTRCDPLVVLAAEREAPIASVRVVLAPLARSRDAERLYGAGAHAVVPRSAELTRELDALQAVFTFFCRTVVTPDPARFPPPGVAAPDPAR